jgi:hypothetical protein
MKKIVLIMAALVLVLSGVAAVSAYEAHLINVKAHVENALLVDTTELNFGTVFPEEWLVAHRTVQLSESAVSELEDNLVSVAFKFFAEWKPIPDSAAFYNWMGYFTYVGYDVDDNAASMTLVGDPVAAAPSAQPILGGPYVLSDDTEHQFYIAIDVPVFEGFYNSLTDPEPKPSGLNDPTYIITRDDWGTAFNPQGMDFGIDLKIQVTDIVRGTAG